MRRPRTEIDPADMFIGGRLREARQGKGLSQAGLGARLGITFQQIQKYEKGSNRVAASTLAHAAKVLGVEPRWFFEGMPDSIVGTAVDAPSNLQSFVASRHGQEWARLGSKLSRDALERLMGVVRLLAADKSGG